jgi:hypothetical protein
MLTLVRQNHACPTCIAGKKSFADLRVNQPERTIQDMRKAFYCAQDLKKSGDIKESQDILKSIGLVDIKV